MKSFRTELVLAVAVLAAAMIGGGCKPGENKSSPPSDKGVGETGKAVSPATETTPVVVPSEKPGVEKVVTESQKEPSPAPAAAPPVKPAAEKPPAQSPSVDVKSPDQPAPGLPSLSAALEKARKEESQHPAEEEPPPPAPRDLGKPLVNDFDQLTKLDKECPIWIDPKQKRVVMVGEVCKPTYGLEMFASLKREEKGYESVVVVDVKAITVHAALVALGAEPGKPVQYLPKFVPPSGPEIDVHLYWKDEKGQEHDCPAQDWIRNVKTKKALDVDWVFAGSRISTDEATKKNFYHGEGGYLICVANTPDAVLDLPTPSSGGLDDRIYESFSEHMPPPGTPVTITLLPKAKAEEKKKG